MHPYPWDYEKVSPEVAEKEKANVWDSLKDFVAVWHAKVDGKWQWYANSRCKYVELRIDMRDGGCIIRDRHGVRISPEQLAYQYKSQEEQEAKFCPHGLDTRLECGKCLDARSAAVEREGK